EEALDDESDPVGVGSHDGGRRILGVRLRRWGRHLRVQRSGPQTHTLGRVYRTPALALLARVAVGRAAGHWDEHRPRCSPRPALVPAVSGRGGVQPAVRGGVQRLPQVAEEAAGPEARLEARRERAPALLALRPGFPRVGPE